MSFAPIEGALGAVKAGLDLIKDVRELLKKDKVNPTEVNSQLLELQELLLQARSSLVEASDYITKLEGDLSAKLQVEELKKSMFYDQTVYWKRTGDAEGAEPDPYCTVCWEKDRVLSHLRPGATKGTYTCQIDGTSYYTDSYNDNHMPVLQRARRR
jgi:hypothetical protein